MKYDIVIIGGNPSGGSAAAAAREIYKDKKVLVIRKEEKSLIPCGIPYVFGTLEDVDNDVKSIQPAKNSGIDFLIDEVQKIVPDEKRLELKTSEDVNYEKLIVATGSTPVVPPIEGSTLKGVISIGKEIDYIKSIHAFLKEGKDVVVIGAGFIGVEMSNEMVKLGAKVTLIEAMDTILPLAFDEDVIAAPAQVLSSHGVEIRVNTKVSKIEGNDGKVSGVRLDSGELITADRVIMATGYRPNVSLAQEAGLSIGSSGGIITDEYLRTNYDGIFAVGDCVEHRDFFTRKQSRLMLASTGASEARIAGMNLYDLRVVRQTKGSIAIFSTSLDDISMGAAGLTEKSALAEGFQVVIGQNKGVDHHPACLPDTKEQMVKLIFSKCAGVILGAQIVGGPSTGEMINILGLAIQKHMTVSELAIMQYGTQPLLTAGPGNYPIVLAAMNALGKIENFKM